MDTPGTSGPYAVAGTVVSMGPRPVATQVSLGVSPLQTQGGDIKSTLSYGPLCTPRCNACWRGLVTLHLLHAAPGFWERRSSYRVNLLQVPTLKSSAGSH